MDDELTRGAAGEVVDLLVVTTVPDRDWPVSADAVAVALRGRLARLAAERGLVLPGGPVPVRTRVQSGQVVAVARSGARPA